MVLLLLTSAACGRSPEAAPAPPAPAASLLAVSCEPSALVRSSSGWVVGDNEDEDGLYRFDDAMALQDRPPLATRIEDVEAIAVDGEGLIVVGSHGVTRSGKVKPERHRVLLADGRVFALALDGFVEREAVNVEGAAVLGGELVLGLRAPLAASHAQLLVVDRGAAAGTILRTVAVDLGGAGVRELAPFRGGLLVVSGPAADRQEPFGLWWLSALDAAPVRLSGSLPSSTEGAWPVNDTTLRVVIDGDGEPGACREAGRWLDVSFAVAPAPVVP